MKRHHLFFDGNTDGAFWRDVEEDPDGEWVKAGEALAEIARLTAENETLRRDANWYSDCEGQYRGENEKLRTVVGALPKCDGPEDFDEDDPDPEECGRTATWRTIEGDALEHYCDQHVSITTGKRKVELPYAEALREMEKA